MAQPLRRWAVALVVAGSCLGSPTGLQAAELAAARAPSGPRLELLGEVRLATGSQVGEVEVGGLSAITYDAGRGLYYAVSDDPGWLGPARFFTLRIDLSDGALADGDVHFEDVTELLDRGGAQFPPGDVDFEGMVLLGDGSLAVSSEGIADRSVPPFLRRYSLSGAVLEELRLPRRFLPSAGGRRGVRDNQAFEALTVSTDGRFLFVGCEASLVQDGPAPDLGQGSPARIVKLDLASGKVVGEYVYPVGPVPDPPVPATAYSDNGLSELVALDDGSLLALERAFSVGVGNRVRLYRATFDGASDVRRFSSLFKVRAGTLRALGKELVIDVSDLGVAADNLEGMTLGPRLPDGRRVLVVVSDNNFNSAQVTQVLAFAIAGDRAVTGVRIRDIQGGDHASPRLGDVVNDVGGIVTAVARARSGQVFWMQDVHPDGDDATTEGIHVVAGAGQPEVSPGDVVVVAGRVEEVGWERSLTVTRIADAVVSVRATAAALPAPVIIGGSGRRPPTGVVDDDGLAVFQPESDAVDYFESLEGMRVSIEDALVVGPTTVFGELVVIAGGGAGAGLRTPRGGIALSEHDVNPERVIVSSWRLDEAPQVRVGDRFADPVSGVLHYAFGHYQLVCDPDLPEIVPSGLSPEVTSLGPAPGRLTVASYNVENLARVSAEDRFAATARIIVHNLRAPDVVALQEVQDDSGPEDDGVVTAAGTLDRLVEAIETTGGPAYRWLQIDPVDGADGGMPGGNIRVAYLVNPARVQAVERAAAGSGQAVSVVAGPHLSASPGRVATDHPAFSGDPDRRGDGTRKSLALELTVAKETVFIVNNHLRSKMEDDPVFGAHQPPRASSEKRRREQAFVVRSLVERLAAEDPQVAVIVLGDLNEYPFRPPLRALAGDLLVNLMETLADNERYTYVYEGNSQALDHVLVSRTLAAGAEIDVVHVNAELPVSERASDHDPVVVRLAFPEHE